MILVLAIVGLLVGAAVVSFGGVLEGGKNTTAKGHISSINPRCALTRWTTCSCPPPQQVCPPRGKSEQSRRSWRPSSRKLPIDPWGNPYHYRRPGTKDKGGFDVYSAGPDGIADNADDMGSWDI
jgi:general secretion pathway protein G